MIRAVLCSNEQRLPARKCLRAVIAPRSSLRARPRSRFRAMRSGSSPCFSTGGGHESYLPRHCPQVFDEVRPPFQRCRGRADKFPVVKARAVAAGVERSWQRRYSRRQKDEAEIFHPMGNYLLCPPAELHFSATLHSAESMSFQPAPDEANRRISF